MAENMKRKLERLFDFQKFENNPELLKLKKESEICYEMSLKDEDLALVNAAGEVDSDQRKKIGLEDI